MKKDKNIIGAEYNNKSIVMKNTLIEKEERRNEKLRKKIEKGLNKPCASTGMPIDNLSGAAEFIAKLSNVGGGSVEIGGGGLKDGFRTVMEYAESNVKLQALKDKDKTNSANSNKLLK